MKMNRYVDVLIPRGGRGLIQAVVNQSTVPVIETGTGNCHIFVDESADLKNAADIVINAKTQRVGVCNACESLLVHEKIKDAFLPVLAERLREKHVEMLSTMRQHAPVFRMRYLLWKRTGVQSIWITSFPLRLLLLWRRQLPTLTDTIPNIPRRFLQTTMKMPRNSWRK